MHLTNYAVNKHNENFVCGPEADSSKWDFAMLRWQSYTSLTLIWTQMTLMHHAKHCCSQQIVICCVDLSCRGLRVDCCECSLQHMITLLGSSAASHYCRQVQMTSHPTSSTQQIKVHMFDVSAFLLSNNKAYGLGSATVLNFIAIATSQSLVLDNITRVHAA